MEGSVSTLLIPSSPVVDGFSYEWPLGIFIQHKYFLQMLQFFL